jgi:NADP-dependent 3-hydroxy acid dehydrogenase YdfG
VRWIEGPFRHVAPRELDRLVGEESGLQLCEIESELKHGTSHSDNSGAIDAIHESLAIPPDSTARALAYAIEQLDDVDFNEIIVRPTTQHF